MVQYLIDTCILIDFFRGNEKAAQFLEEFVHPPFLSALTVAELYAGVREGRERALLAATAECKSLTLATCNVKHFPMTERICCPY